MGGSVLYSKVADTWLVSHLPIIGVYKTPSSPTKAPFPPSCFLSQHRQHRYQTWGLQVICSTTPLAYFLLKCHGADFLEIPDFKIVPKTCPIENIKRPEEACLHCWCCQATKTVGKQ